MADSGVLVQWHAISVRLLRWVGVVEALAGWCFRSPAWKAATGHNGTRDLGVGPASDREHPCRTARMANRVIERWGMAWLRRCTSERWMIQAGEGEGHQGGPRQIFIYPALARAMTLPVQCQKTPCSGTLVLWAESYGQEELGICESFHECGRSS